MLSLGKFETILYMSHYLWDYDEKELQKTEKGRIFILGRKINYGPGKEKIKLSEVKKYWNQLDLYEAPKHLMELLIWGKCQSSHQSKNLFSI